MNSLAPFTMNQKAYFDRCFSSWLNVAEGGKRGGKNVLSTLAFCILLEHHPDRLHLAAGVSIAAAKLNILDCDGFGMLNYFEGRYREGEYKNRDCLYIITATGEKIVLISGGGKDGDQKLIKGNTYGMAYVTEANECHPNFIKEVFDRTLSSSDRKVFHDLNPKAPSHKYYTDVLQHHEDAQKANPAYGYNYGHFTIADNLSVSDEKLKAIIATYDKNSIWYKRDIKGRRIQAEGVIYGTFAADPERFIVDAPPEILFSHIGIDFGGTDSAHAFQCTGFARNLSAVVTLDELYTKDALTPAGLDKLYVEFVQRNKKWNPVEAFADSAEQVLMRGLQAASIRAGVGLPISNARKGPVMERARFYCRMFDTDRYKIMRHCKRTIGAFSDAVYKGSKQDDERLDDGTTNIDTLDAQEYSTEKFQKDILDLINYGVT